MIERFRTAMEEEGHNCEMCNAGAMMPWMDYTPRTLGEIIFIADIFRMNNKRRAAPKREAEQNLLLETESDRRDNEGEGSSACR